MHARNTLMIDRNIISIPFCIRAPADDTAMRFLYTESLPHKRV